MSDYTDYPHYLHFKVGIKESKNKNTNEISDEPIKMSLELLKSQHTYLHCCLKTELDSN